MADLRDRERGVVLGLDTVEHLASNGVDPLVQLGVVAYLGPLPEIVLFDVAFLGRVLFVGADDWNNLAALQAYLCAP